MAPTPSAGSPERPRGPTGQPAGRTAEYWIQARSLQPHPEGGHVRSLLRGPERSLLHRLRSDFELADRATSLSRYPAHRQAIERLTR